jgi:hypothetical protein
MVDLAPAKANPIEFIREFARSGRELSESTLNRAVDFVNSGKHPRFPGAKQRVTVEDLRKAFQILSRELSDPNSTASKSIDIFLKRTNELSNKLQSAKQDLEKPTFLSRIKAFFKTIFAKIVFFTGVTSDMGSTVSSPA